MLSAGKAPSFRLPDVDGRQRSLEQILSEGPAVLAFFKVSCPVCQYTFPFLERINHNSKLRLYGVSQDGSEATKEFMSEFGISFPALIDEKRLGYPASNGFSITHVPSIFQVERDGSISHAWDGFSQADMQALGDRAGVPVFASGEQVPEYKPG
ncbi:MAG: TlpA family protein disulfide reductase [Acidobacteria bacterium]|nr:TlpA family protein disulfide reductase [Acidobacteriota bacterium]